MSDERTHRPARTRLTVALPALLAAFGGLLVIAMSFAVFADWSILRADLSTYLLPGVARANGLGNLYVDYFDIKPPFAYAMFLPWLATVGQSLTGMWVFYAFLLAAMLAAFWVALRQQLSAWLALVLFSCAALVVVYFGMLEELFFVTEVVCLVLVLWAVVVARKLGGHLGWLFAAGLLVGAAGQVKEVFILAPVALLPVAWTHARRWPALGALAGGVATALALAVGVLLWWGDGVLTAYGEVFALKRGRFPAPTPGEAVQAAGEHLAQIVHWVPLLALFLVAAVATAAARILRQRRGLPPASRAWRLSAAEWMLVLLFVTTFAAFVWQGAPLIRHYAVAVVYPLYLLLAVLLTHALASVQWMRVTPRRLVSTLLVVTLLPPVAAALWGYGRAIAIRPVAIVDAARNAESADDLAIFDAIADAAGDDGCLQVAYGWSASAYYLYSGLRPCSRFVVPPLALTPGLRDEMRETLIANPPDVLVVDPLYAVETTVPESEGTPETAVFPFAAVAEHCYAPMAGWPTVYLPADDRATTSACIAAEVDATR